MTGTPSRPSRRLLRRGVLLGLLGLVALPCSSVGVPDDVMSRNDALTWLAILGVFGGLGMVLGGAVAVLVGLVKWFREPKPPRDPTVKHPTVGQAAAIVLGSVVLGLSTCGAF